MERVFESGQEEGWRNGKKCYTLVSLEGSCHGLFWFPHHCLSVAFWFFHFFLIVYQSQLIYVALLCNCGSTYFSNAGGKRRIQKRFSLPQKQMNGILINVMCILSLIFILI